MIFKSDRSYDRLCSTLSRSEWQAFYERQKQRRNTNYSILIVDIDHLKQINDYFGHQVSDLALRHVASALLYKVSWKPHPVWRVGGDDFVVFMRGLSVEQATYEAKAIQENLRPFKLGSDTPITVTMGVADSYAGASWEQVIFAAENALHRGKHEGCNRIVVANADDYSLPSA